MSHRPPPPPPSRKHTRPEPLDAIDLEQVALPRLAVFKAMLLYLKTPGRSVDDVWRNGRMGHRDEDPYIRDCVALGYLRKVATQEKWAKQRDEHWEDVKAEVRKRLRAQAVEAEMDELARLATIESALVAQITGRNPVKARSMEGAANAIVRLGQYRDSKRHGLREAVAGTIGVESEEENVIDAGAPDLEDAYTDEELDAMTRAILLSRVGPTPSHEGEE